MRKISIIIVMLGLFCLAGYAPEPEMNYDPIKANTNALGGGYWTDNMTSTFRIYPSDYRSRKIASILNSEDTIK